jgi:urease accessory protein
LIAAGFRGSPIAKRVLRFAIFVKEEAMQKFVNYSLTLILMLAPTTALAHTGHGDTTGFVQGFFHPVSGIDHVLAMVAVGIFAAHLGGPALWAVPLTFVTMMAAGGALGMAGVAIPYVEIGIGLSVVALGLAIALGVSLPVVGAMALVGLFAIFHGHAHGAEMPDTASGFAYGPGFVVATAALHAVGIGLGLATGMLGQMRGWHVAQVGGGGLMAVAGVAILAGVI